MANDLIQLAGQVEQYIDPNGAPGSILAQNHQNLLLSVLQNVGRLTGLQFKARKEAPGGVVSLGFLVWNSNNLNTTTPFTLTLSEITLDNQKVVRVLSRLKKGDLIKFKDTKGRAVFLEFDKYSEDTDVNMNVVYNLIVKGFPENINYLYQDTEVLDCMIEFFPANIETGLNAVQNSIQQMKLDFFWSHMDDEGEPMYTRYFVSSRIGGKVAKLGIKIQNYSVLDNFPGATFTLLIDRYRKTGWRGNAKNYPVQSHRKAGYKHADPTKPDTYGTLRKYELQITGSKMLIDFGQDFYFREKGVTFGAQDSFPRATGTKPKSFHLTSSTALGYVDLGFRIRIEIADENYKWESQHLGFIRMIGVDDNSIPAERKTYITYSYK